MCELLNVKKHVERSLVNNSGNICKITVFLCRTIIDCCNNSWKTCKITMCVCKTWTDHFSKFSFDIDLNHGILNLVVLFLYSQAFDLLVFDLFCTVQYQETVSMYKSFSRLAP